MSNSTVSQLDLAVAQPDLQPQAGSSVPEAQTPPPRPPPRRLILQGARATRAYGIQLSPECLDRFCRKYHEMVRPGQLEKMTAKQVRVALRDILSPTLLAIPREIYRAVPTLPRLWRNIILLDPTAGTFMFVLKDNSSVAAFNTTISREDVQRVKAVLQMEDTPMRWFKVRVE